jgi:beta-glucosidase
MVRFSDGAQTQAVKLMVPLSGSIAFSSNRLTPAQENELNPAKVARITAAIDTVRAGKTGYAPALFPIAAYTENAGDLTITIRDIEAEITTLMTGKTKEWKVYQITHGNAGTQGKEDANFGIYVYEMNASNLSLVDRRNYVKKAMDLAIATAKVPVIFSSDCVHGMNYATAGVILPHNIGLGCMGKPKLVELVYRVSALECRGVGLDWLWSPCIDITRNERYGRTYEGFDEGPLGTAACARAAVRGFQGTDLSCDYTIAATTKHFAGAAGIMAAHNSWLGVKMHSNSGLLIDTLRTAWKWDGVAMADYDESRIIGMAKTLDFGVDVPTSPDLGQGYKDMVSGAAEARLNEAVRRMLRLKFRTNIIASPYPKEYLTQFIRSDKHLEIVREAVRRSLVLMKNENKALPLDSTKNVHLVGSHCDNISLQCGGWTLGWPTN